MNQIAVAMNDILVFLGCRVKRSPRKTKFNIYISLVAYMAVECFIAFVKNWDDLTNRFLAFEDINYLSVILCVLIELFLLPEDANLCLDILEKDFFDDRNAGPPNKAKYNLKKRFMKSTEKFLKAIKIILKIIIGSIMFPPFLITLHKTFFANSGNLEPMTFDLPLEFSYKTTTFLVKQPNVFLYAAIYILQILCNVIAFYVGLILLLRIVGPAGKLKMEIKMFRISIDDLETRFSRGVPNRSTSSENDCEILRRCLSSLIDHHVFIIRQTKAMNRSVRFNAFSTAQAICIQFCVCLYGIAELDIAPFFKLKNMMVILLDVIYYYLYSKIGEEFIKEGEVLHNKLYEMCWYDKPVWVQRTLLMMLTQGSKPLRIKPMGLFVIGLKSFTNVLNSGYSFFNILRTVKGQT